MTDPEVSARFLDGLRGKLLVLARVPLKATGGALLIVPPFAEEMNKTRWMYAEVARQLAARGVASALPDLYGTGDSEGEFREADWEVWKDDLARTAAWMQAQGRPVTAVLCTRLGCILGAEAASGLPGPIRKTVFWQPVVDGKRFLAQFLRLRIAARMMTGERTESVATLRETLRNAGSLEIAGYDVSARIAEQIDGLALLELAGKSLGDLHWMEIVPEPADAPTPAAQRAMASLEARGTVTSAQLHSIAGEPFWSSTEIVRNAELIARTVSVLAAA